MLRHGNTSNQGMKMKLIPRRYITVMLMLNILLLSSINPLLATEAVDETLVVESDSLIEMKNVSGQVSIIGWDKNTVNIAGELGENTESFRFERIGKTVIIEVKVKNSDKGWSWNNNGNGDTLMVYVPHNSRFDYYSPNTDLSINDVYGGAEINMVNGDLRAENLRGSVSLQTVNGDINATQISGEFTLDAVNGDIKASQVKGNTVTANTVNGDMSISSVASQVHAETVNGEIEFMLQSVSQIKTNTVNGSIEMTMNLTDGGTVKASSVSGDIKFAFQKGVQAKFDLEAHAGGTIRNRLTSEKPNKAKYGPRRWLEFSTGQPTAWVDVSTVSGRIEVEASR